MKNACNGLCGCHYCWDCIEIYLNGDERCCPGQSDDCKTQLLSIDGNILVDQSTLNKISRIVVKCTESSQPTDEFKKINDTLNEYETGEVKCPYSKLGCCEPKLIRDEINNHLNFQNYSHTKLLMQWIDNLKNELQTIKLDIANSRKENKDLRMEIEYIKMDVDKKQAVISELLISDEMKSQQIEYLMKQFHIDTPTQSNGTIRFDEYEPVINENTKYRFQHTFHLQVCDLDDAIDSMDLYDNTIHDSPMKSDTIHRTMEIFYDKIETIDRKIMQLQATQESQNYGEFVWTIDNLSDKIGIARKEINREIYSDSFYSHRNGYKMCMRVDPSGINVGKGSHLAIYFCMLQGPFDDILQWPMRHSVTFALIDQQSGLVHKSRTARFEDVPDNFAWNKPTADKKIGFGYHKFISMDELLNNERLCRNDQIFITCSVDTALS